MATGSKTIDIDIKLPTKWEDLTQKQLLFVFAMLAQGHAPVEVKTYCLFKWAHMSIMHRYGNGWYVKLQKEEFVLMAEQVNNLITTLAFLDAVPEAPVRMEKLGFHKAIDARFQGVPFETYIICDNLYQGYLATQNDELLDEMATHLYKLKTGKHLKPKYRINIFYWFAALKILLSREFHDFFQPLAEQDENLMKSNRSKYELLNDALNSQIRALTKGDITKEKEVLQMDTWRALAELNAQAKEYAEMKKMYKK